jgi:hypothetical protein
LATNLKKALILEEQKVFTLSTICDDQVSNENLPMNIWHSSVKKNLWN